MWILDTIRSLVDVIIICLMIVVLYSLAFGHNKHIITSANRQIRHAINSSKRREFVAIFDADPAFEEEEFRQETQARVDQKLNVVASLVGEYEERIKNFKADLTKGFTDHDSQMQLTNLISNASSHRRTFWNAHEVAKSCGYTVRPSIYDYVSTTEIDIDSEDGPNNIVSLERER